MLSELEIKNLGPIRHADIEFGHGLVAITGETGAGKSMLLSALDLISGGAVDSSRVSPGQSQAWAQAIFDTRPHDSNDSDGSAEHPAVRAALDAGVEVEDGELFLTRSVPVDGRSKAVLNGNSVPRSVLKQVATELITIHGQAEQLRIGSHAKQRELLDSYAHDLAQLEKYHEAFHELNELDARLDRLKNQQSDIRQRAQFLRDSIAHIDEVSPKPHEDEELVAQRTRIENSAQIVQAVSGAVGALDPSVVSDSAVDSAPVVTLLRQAIDSLGPVSTFPEYQDSINRLNAACEELQDIIFDLNSHLDFDDVEEADLDELNSRIYQLGDLVKRWGPTLDDVIEWRKKAEFELEDVEASPEQIEQFEATRAELFGKVMGLAEELHEVRAQAAEKLSESVNSELGALAMEGSSLKVDVVLSGEPDTNGADHIEFLFTPFPGSAPLPLGRSASGGELSRLMLALELSMTAEHSNASDETFVFDEIDAGVGGVAALELGKRLARLAQNVQVVVVTHLPQVASWADSQFIVSKGAVSKDADASVETVVRQVEGDARVDEIARMLSGSISQTSRQHAKELLEASVLQS
jgi:DNA repair protein RecN (Recombination protein N)